MSHRPPGPFAVVAIRLRNGSRLRWYWPKKLRVWLAPDEVRALLVRRIVVPVSYVPEGSTTWQNGRFRLRNPARTQSHFRTHPGEIELLPDEFLEILNMKGLGVYRVERHDPTALHIGWAEW